MPLFGPPKVEKMQADRNVRGLIKALGFRKDGYVRRTAAEALGQIGDEQAVEPLIAALGDQDPEVRVAAVLARNDAYRRVTVDSNERCHRCALRYVCGGFCRAWGASDDADRPPVDCTALRERARGLLVSALEALDVSVERWQAAGLPLPQ